MHTRHCSTSAQPHHSLQPKHSPCTVIQISRSRQRCSQSMQHCVCQLLVNSTNLEMKGRGILVLIHSGIDIITPVGSYSIYIKQSSESHAFQEMERKKRHAKRLCAHSVRCALRADTEKWGQDSMIISIVPDRCCRNIKEVNMWEV